MDQEKLSIMIKDNKGILRQLTDITNRLEKLEKDIEGFKCSIMGFNRRGFEMLPGVDASDKEIANIKVGGTD